MRILFKYVNSDKYVVHFERVFIDIKKLETRNTYKKVYDKDHLECTFNDILFVFIKGYEKRITYGDDDYSYTLPLKHLEMGKISVS